MNRYIQFIETSYKNIDPLLGDKVGLFEKHPNLLTRDNYVGAKLVKNIEISKQISKNQEF